MSSFIAFCSNPSCGAVFEVPNLIGGDGTATIEMVGTTVGPCPACGSTGRIPDGVYEYANHAVNLLKGPELTVRALKQVKEILERARSKPSSKEEVLKEVESVSPEAAKALGSAPDSSNYLQWIGIVIALIALAIQAHTSYFKDDDVEKQFREYLLKENESLKQKLEKPKTFKRNEPKVPRNAPCPCGSGKKYKKCCYLTKV